MNPKSSQTSSNFISQLKAGIKHSYALGWLVPYFRAIQNNIQAAKNNVRATQASLNRALIARKYSTIAKQEFIEDLRQAMAKDVGYAAGKIGLTAQYMARYEMMLQSEPDQATIEKYESRLEFMCLKQQGIFPNDNDFYRRYSTFYIDHTRHLDCLGICYYPGELEVLKYHKLTNKMIHYVQQEPDRSSPSNNNNCYLQYFREKRLLIVCPFGELLAQRANEKTFEKVWQKTGKKWFYPKSVDALEFPYGFSPDTHKVYPTIFELLHDITNRLHKIEFDVALIAAAGLAIPLASHIKGMGKIAIDLGGHLQFLFGVIGQRWRNSKESKTKYFNEHWIDMPAMYKPRQTDVCDFGAYW